MVTAPIAGLYLVTLEAQWTADTGGRRSVRVRHLRGDGGVLVREAISEVTGSELDTTVSTTLAMAAGDQVQVRYAHSGSEPINLRHQDTSLAMTWIAPAP